VQIKRQPRKVSKRYASAGMPHAESVSHDFSYSGMKTAVLRHVETHGMKESIERRRDALSKLAKPTSDDIKVLTEQHTIDLVASFQAAIVRDLVNKTIAAARDTDAATLLVTGGVAANSELRAKFEEAAGENGLRVYFPSLRLSTDNAAMIAAAAYPKFIAGEFAPEELTAEAGLVLR
jgi:N6-L-threonylcarbamoyladenine synthase